MTSVPVGGPMLVLFKAFLLFSVLGLGYLLFFRVRLLIFQRLLGVALGSVLCFFIVLPEWSTRVAHWFGINRGVDFVLYLLGVFFTYMIVRLYLRQQHFQKQLTTLTRALALRDADKPENP